MMTRVVDLRYSLVRKEDNQEVIGTFCAVVTGDSPEHVKELAISEFHRYHPPAHRSAVTVIRVREEEPVTVRYS